MSLKEELSAVQPSIREALDQLGFQSGIPYALGSCKGGAIKLYEFCTFTTAGHEPLVLGVTIKQGETALELVLDLVEEDSGYMHWKVNLGLSEGGIPKLVETALTTLPKVSVIKKILLPEPKPEEPKSQKQILTELVRQIRHGEVTVERGVEMVEEALVSMVKTALASQARNITKYLEKYTG